MEKDRIPVLHDKLVIRGTDNRTDVGFPFPDNTGATIARAELLMELHRDSGDLSPEDKVRLLVGTARLYAMRYLRFIRQNASVSYIGETRKAALKMLAGAAEIIEACKKNDVYPEIRIMLLQLEAASVHELIALGPTELFMTPSREA